MNLAHRKKSGASGFTLIEVLVTLLIIAIGLLGLAGLQLTSLQNQLEAYQRAQAVLLAEEMANRIRANAPAARDGEYTPGTQYGLLPSVACDPNSMSTAAYDLCGWNNILMGQGVKLGSINAGSVNSARGCIENMASTDDDESRIRVTVAWMGTSATQAPYSNCGVDEYGDDDGVRRVAIIDTVLADLANDPNSP